MARTKKSWKRGLRSNDGKPTKKKIKTEGVRGDWKPIERSSPAMEAYYKTLNIIPESEWEEFITILKTDLPATFRVVDSRGDSVALNNIMKEKYFSKLPGIMIEDKPAPLPTNLAWYPNGLAWQINMSRPMLRHSQELLSLHQFLVSEAEHRSIARQEAVSMIPPLVLDVKPHHVVLDMCAAPGNKTLQLLEALHSEGPNPSGFIIANDSDNRRCYMLVTQTKRFNSLAFMITNEDATRFPNLKVFDENKNVKVLKYDRILCDVPCTGDGTVRKNYAIWQKWNMGQALGIHKLQRRILLRGMDMLKEGGRIVYSTCSLNPIENEATVLSALINRPGFALLPTSELLPGLDRREGLTSWKVMHSSGTWYDKFEDVEEKHRKSVAPTMFCELAEKYNLQYCMRVYPHQQNTGGFFICVIEKLVEPMKEPELPNAKSEVPKTEPAVEPPPETLADDIKPELTEDAAVTEENKPNIHRDTNVLVDNMKWKKFHGYREDPFFFLEPGSECFTGVKEFYDLSDSFPYQNMFVRSEQSKQRNLAVACSQIKDIIEQNNKKIKVINCGLRLFSYCKEAFSKCPYRLLQEGAHFTSQFMGQKLFDVSLDDMKKLLGPIMIVKSDLESSLYEKVKDLPQGIIVFFLKSSGTSPEFHVCVFATENNVKAYITEDEKNHYRMLVGLEPLLSKRKVKKIAAMEYHRQKREDTAERIAMEHVIAKELLVDHDLENEIKVEPDADVAECMEQTPSGDIKAESN